MPARIWARSFFRRSMLFPRAERAGLGSLLAGVLATAACAGGPAVAPHGPVPLPQRPAVETEPPDTVPLTVNPPPSLRQPAAPAELARAKGWMPLAATGVPQFLTAHPAWDGRGVLIGILDSGIDAGAAGLDSTTTGRPKLIDLRDFSGEGKLPLHPVTPAGDSILVAGKILRGFGRVRALAASGPWYAGVFYERLLGDSVASDVNDNASDGDSLVVVVARASDGWVLFADTDGNGSLSGERPVHDYGVARETFGWHQAGQPTPLTLAVNFSDSPSGPLLDLFFDTSAHGTHVAGIAAGYGIGGAAGLDGVAPGAQLLGLKIARNDFGGISTTGSMLAAVDYAIKFAARRSLPLVLNMSFGVGNEREGTARLDALIDSVLSAHPEVVFVTSAGNDGPALSTMGFPGSARRPITVGATEPWALSAGAASGGRPAPDVVLFFSARGGEMGKPDLVAPGIAYSTVPRWNMGDEFKGGTSMASPHVAGLAALLVSAALEQKRTVTAFDLRRALTGSASALSGEGPVDEGAGVPNIESAWEILRAPAPAAEFDVEFLGQRGATAAYRINPPSSDTLLQFRVTRRSARPGPIELTLASTASWLTGPSTVRLDGPVDTITLRQHPPRAPGAYSAAVRATAAGSRGPLFSLVSTVAIPASTKVTAVRMSGTLEAGHTRRVFFAADSGRPFRVRTATASAREHLISTLHQPGGVPFLGENGIPGSADTLAAVYDMDGRDAVGGLYETDAVAASDRPVTATIQIDPSPVGIVLGRGPADSFAVTMKSFADSAVSGRLDIGLLGGESRFDVSAVGSDDVTLPFTLPGWARRVVLDLELDPVQWSRFTDFGFALRDAQGRILGKGPANYAHARFTAEVPAGTPDQRAAIVLAPAFADSGSRERWAARVTIRLEAERPTALVTDGGDEFKLAPGASKAHRGRLGDLPMTLPAGFVPLVVLFVESGGISWQWELPVGTPGTPGKP
ncbi:MAG TPA: S8 family serine peptidase [Gemmatimonadales bacterium]|nr:S8 family serine peptidase [Gemmatimonadales bacterium]